MPKHRHCCIQLSFDEDDCAFAGAWCELTKLEKQQELTFIAASSGMLIVDDCAFADGLNPACLWIEQKN